jgi:hypothetical protein
MLMLTQNAIKMSLSVGLFPRSHSQSYSSEIDLKYKTKLKKATKNQGLKVLQLLRAEVEIRK